MPSAETAASHGTASKARIVTRWSSPVLLDVLLVIAIVVTGAVLRWPFIASGAPMFVTPDSESYLLPGWELAHGQGFNPELRRTPMYSVFIAGVLLLLGDNLERLAAVQHGVGVLTALVSFACARTVFGSLAGGIAGLAVATSGPLLIYEHYLLSEALFTFLLTAALGTVMLGLSRGSGRILFLSGILLALGALCRPIGQLALPIALLFVLLSGGRSIQLGLQRLAYVALGIGLVLAPWMVRNLATHQTFAAEGALGQALIGRTIRHDRGFVYHDPARPDPDPIREAARRIITEDAATGEPSGGRITARIREELGLSQSQTSTLLRGLALQSIWDHRGHYAQSTWTFAWELWDGKIERLLGHWRQRTTRNWDNKWDPRIAPLVDDELPAEGQAYRQVDAAANFAQPFRHRRNLSYAIAIGAVLALLVPRWRLALLPFTVALAMILASAALDGPVYRYRYPVDPLLAILAAGGIAGPLTLTWQLVQSRHRRPL
ncbi:MAG: glycosyltransferase family 39 protein [Chloroflexota bacterium]